MNVIYRNIIRTQLRVYTAIFLSSVNIAKPATESALSVWVGEKA